MNAVRHPAQTSLTILGSSGIVLIFLPFYSFGTPWQWFDPLSPDILLAILAPCVILPFLIFVGYVRWLLIGPLSRWESLFAYAAAAVAAVGPLVAFFSPYGDGSLLVFLAPLAAAAWFITGSLRAGTSTAPTPLAAMQVVYLVFAVYWLTGANIDIVEWRPMTDARSGGWLAYVTVIAYTLQAALLVRGRPRRLVTLAPLALVWVLSVMCGLAIS